MTDLPAVRTALTLDVPPSLDEIAKRGLPDGLSGRDGANRCRTGVRQIAADTDIEAIQLWLAEYADRTATLRAYRKEVQRFYCWVIGIARKPLSSLTREDLGGYREFLAAPPASWCGRRNARKSTGEWKPFEGPLSDRSQAYAMAVIEGLFKYLTDVRYLDGNPFKAARFRRKVGPPPGLADKFLPLHTFERLMAALQSECERLMGQGDQHIEVERMLFVVRFMANTGLRREEMANARLGDLSHRDIPGASDCWFLRVTGKGDKTATIAINRAAMGALERYFRLLKLDPRRSDPHTPLVLKIGMTGLKASLSKPVGPDSIYGIVTNALELAASILNDEHPEDARKLREATPHWFRHTFTTLMTQQGHPLPLIQSQLRHASIATTAIYSHTEEDAMYRAVNGLQL